MWTSRTLNFVPCDSPVSRRGFLRGCLAGAAAFAWPARRCAVVSADAAPLPHAWSAWAAALGFERGRETTSGPWDALIVVRPGADWSLRLAEWLVQSRRIWLDAPPLPAPGSLPATAAAARGRIWAEWPGFASGLLRSTSAQWTRWTVDLSPADAAFRGLSAWFHERGGEAPRIGAAGSEGRWLVTLEAANAPILAITPSPAQPSESTAPWRPAARWLAGRPSGVRGDVLLRAAECTHAALPRLVAVGADGKA